MVPRFTMSLHFFFSFMMTCMAMSVRAELTKVPLRPYLRGNSGLLPQAISSQEDISVVKGVEDCNGQTGCLLKDGAPPPELVSIAPLSDLVSLDRRFPFEALLNQKSEACSENKDGSDTEDDDDEDDDGDAEDQDDDDDANDEDFSGEEGGDDDDCEGDPEEDPTANGNEGSDDDDDEDGDDEDGDDEEGDDDEQEEEEEDDEEDEDQPPAKKRK